jgi:hypothetical protein
MKQGARARPRTVNHGYNTYRLPCCLHDRLIDCTAGAGTMPRAAGIVIIVAENRRKPLLEAIEADATVAEAIPEFQHSRNAPLIAFVSFESGRLTHIASARRGMRAATGLSRLNLSEVFKLPQSIPVNDILSALPKRIRQHAAERLAYGGLLPPATFVAVR